MQFKVEFGRRRRRNNPAIPAGTGQIVRRAIPLLTGRSRSALLSVVVILVGLGALAFKQHWFGLGAPRSADPAPRNAAPAPAPAPSPTAPTATAGHPYAAYGLEALGGERWRSPGGLVYGPDRTFGNRVEHVLAHAKPDPSKPSHSVFSVPETEIFHLIDQAWARHGKPDADDPGSYLVYMGGKVIGKSTRGAECRHLQIIVATDGGGKNPKVPVEVISAYPAAKSGQ